MENVDWVGYPYKGRYGQKNRHPKAAAKNKKKGGIILLDVVSKNLFWADVKQPQYWFLPKSFMAFSTSGL